MKRIVLATCILAVLALAVVAAWILVRHNEAARTLARARVALRAEQAEKALKLADEYVRRAPDDWRGHMVRGLAFTQLGNYEQARQALQKAVELSPGEISARIALARTHVLPALRALDSTGSPPQVSELQTGIEDLQKANNVLQAAKAISPAGDLALRQVAASNTMYMARISHKIADGLADDLRMAQAGHATERLEEIRRHCAAAGERARSLERQAVERLCQVLSDARKLLGSMSEQSEKGLVAKHTDTAARDLVQLCADFNYAEHRRAVGEALAGLEEISPVAVALATAHDVRFGRFPSAREHRSALARAVQCLDRLEEIARNRPEQRREVLLSRASLALVQKDCDTAERTCREVLKDTPSQPTARLLLAEAMMARGQFTEAEKALFVLKTEMPRWPDAAFAYGQAAAATGKRELANSAMQTVTELNPRHAAARRFLIDSYLREGYLEQAYAHACEYHLNCGQDPLALGLLVATAIATNRPATADKAVEQAVGELPGRPQMLVAAAEAYALLGDEARSVEAARKAAQLKPDDTPSRLAAARALVMIGRTAEAEAILTRELAESGDSATAHFEMGRLYAATERPMEAVDQYQAALDAEPENLNYRLALAEALLRAGSLRRCGEVLKALPAGYPNARPLRLQLKLLEGTGLSAAEMIAQTGGQKPALLPLARGLLDRQEPARCLEVCLKQLEAAGADADWRVLAGEACLAMGRTSESLEHWKAALAAAPDRLDIYLRLARLLARNRPADHICKDLAAMPGARRELADLAVCMLLSDRGDRADAVKLCRGIIDHKDASPWARNSARLLLAQLLGATGDTQGALAELDAVAQDKPWEDEALMAKASLLLATRQQKKAVEILSRLRTKARESGNVELIERVIDLLQDAGEAGLALACCDDMLQLPTGARTAEFVKAEIHRSTGRGDLAAACYRKAIDAYPGDLAARRELVEVLDAQCKPTEAWEALREMESLGPAGRAQAMLARASLLSRWGLHDETIECLSAMADLGYEDNCSVQFAMGRALADIGETEKAREHLRRIPRHAPEYLDGRIGLAGLAASPDEALGIFGELEAAYPGNAKVLEQVLWVLLRNRRAAQAAEKFRAFVKTNCHERSVPEAAAFLAIQAMLEAGDANGAWELAARLASQTGKGMWRRMAGLLAPGPKAAEIASADTPEGASLLIGIVNASRFGDAEKLRTMAAKFEAACVGRPDASEPAYRILVALIADGSHDPQKIVRSLQKGALTSVPLESLAPEPPGDRARKVLEDLPPGQLPGALRAAAVALSSCSNRDRQKQQATALLRASVAMDMDLRAFARRIAVDVLSADKTCQWAAVLAVTARGDAQSMREALAMLQPADCAAALALQAELKLQEGKYEESAEAFRRARGLIREAFDLRLREAVALEKAGNLSDALELYRQALSGAHGDAAATAANNAAYVAARLFPNDKARLLEAHAWSCSAVKARPNVYTFHDTRGWIAHLLGRKDEACLELRKALQGMADSPEVHSHLAEAEAAAGNKDLARWHSQAAERLRRKDALRDRPVAGTGQGHGPTEVR